MIYVFHIFVICLYPLHYLSFPTLFISLFPSSLPFCSYFLSLSALPALPLHVQEACSRFGVKALPKRHMIAKLEEIYNYSHPFVGTIQVNSQGCTVQYFSCFILHHLADETGEIVPGGEEMGMSQAEIQTGQSRQKTKNKKGDNNRHEVNSLFY